MAKAWYKSRTLWLNLIGLAAIGVQAYNGYVISVGEEAALLSVANMILRLITSEGIEGFSGQ